MITGIYIIKFVHSILPKKLPRVLCFSIVPYYCFHPSNIFFTNQQSPSPTPTVICMTSTPELPTKFCSKKLSPPSWTRMKDKYLNISALKQPLNFQTFKSANPARSTGSYLVLRVLGDGFQWDIFYSARLKPTM